jgi:predicted metalloprotease with PDZ domain
MMSLRCFRTAVLAAAALAGLPEAVHAEIAKGPVKLEVDLREAPKHWFRAKVTLPVTAGPVTLVYPKWIPGEHAPNGPVADLTGLKFRAGGKEISWRRDDVDMYALHCDVPPGANELEVALDYISPAGVKPGREKPSATSQLAILNWYMVLLYPRNAKSDDLTYTATLQIPEGWKFGTALPVASATGARIEFQPASLTTLVDSPVLTGAHMRTIDLSPGQTPQHLVHIAGDNEIALQVPADVVQRWRQLVAETGALFGARHYRHYDFLLTVSDNVEVDGVEHHESSDNRVPAKVFSDPDIAETTTDLLPHEFTHSWNGKYKRPAGLVTPNYQEPMKGDLLWVYEGMTQYWGTILSARVGSWTPEKLREALAWVAAYLNDRPGRRWRDLEDTAVAAQLLYGAPEQYDNWRRSVDYYDEGTLIWLEADTIIRQRTNGQKSLDDFCKVFEGAPSTGPKIVPYTFEDLLNALNGVTTYDWRGFFTERLHSHGTGAPLKGIENSGWKLIFNETPNEHMRADDGVKHVTDVQFSLGFIVRDPGGEDGGEIGDVILGSPAAKAGLAPGMRLVAVNGQRWSPDVLHEAILRGKDGQGGIELLVENQGYFETLFVDYHGGERYPHLQAIGGKPDVLSQIAKMKAAPVPTAPY